ncbi:MAG: MoaD/ThiS family protein [Candidatus Bathyarchaeia archaeon]|nr:MoaD/ThiS family protein [Candidatus Bathyarchaeota archaeon]
MDKGHVSIRLLGGFGYAAGDHMTMELEGERSLGELLEDLAGRYSLRLKGFGSHFLVLIDGVEAGLLGGLEAKVRPGCELVLLRVSHGG